MKTALTLENAIVSESKYRWMLPSCPLPALPDSEAAGYRSEVRRIASG
jgi:hypothetical protein